MYQSSIRCMDFELFTISFSHFHCLTYDAILSNIFVNSIIRGILHIFSAENLFGELHFSEFSSKMNKRNVFTKGGLYHGEIS